MLKAYAKQQSQWESYPDFVQTLANKIYDDFTDCVEEDCPSMLDVAEAIQDVIMAEAVEIAMAAIKLEPDTFRSILRGVDEFQPFWDFNQEQVRGWGTKS